VSGFLPLALLLLARPAPASAQDFNVSATVNRTQITLEEQLVLTVTVSGTSASLPEPRLPPTPNFNIHGAGQSHNFSFVNGVMTNSAEYRYVLVPRFAGRAVIGPITVSGGGAARTTAPIEIAVLKHGPAQQGAAPPPQAQAPAAPQQQTAPPPSGALPRGAGGFGPDIYVVADVDKRNPYVNEQVLLTVRFYTAVQLMGNAEWHPPTTQGFLLEDIPPGQPQQVVERGRRYSVSEIKMALFPAQAGELTIGPSSIVCQVQQEMNVDPFSPDFFQRFFAQGLMQVQSKELKTKSIVLRALPTPSDGKPASFTGAVGRLKVSAEADKRSLKVGDAINLTVTVEGTGNLKTLGEPSIPDVPEFKRYDTVSTVNLAKDGAGVKGSKVFKTVLVPKASGPLRIPPIQVSYFDPSRREYGTVETRPIEIEVAPGAAQAPAPTYVAANPQGGAITQLSQDIRHVKGPRRLGPGRAAAAVSRTLWIHLIPAAVFLLALASFLHQERLLNDPVGTRFRKALDKAELKLAEARGRQTSSPQQAAGLLSEALTEFLGDKLNCPHSGLTLKQAQGTLRQRFPRMPEGHLNQLKLLWEEIGLYRYAPSGPGGAGDAKQIVEGVGELLRALNEEMKR
jgi:hypothetical protein